MSRLGFGYIAAAISAAFVLFATTAPASASECQPFPKVAAWGDYTHARVTGIVNTRLHGDWDSYVAHLDKRLRLIEDAQRQGKTVVLNFDGQRYQYASEELANYVRTAEQRLRVVECLAREAEIVKLQQFTTAAGGPDNSPRDNSPRDNSLRDNSPRNNSPRDDTPFTEVANAGAAALIGSKLDLAVETSCNAGDAVFRFTNRGETWPMRGTISIYRLGNGAPIKVHARSMRFSGGQSISFKIPAGKNPTGQLGVFVEPSWTKRPFAIDRTLTCR